MTTPRRSEVSARIAGSIAVGIVVNAGANGATGGNVHLRTALFQTATDEGRSLDLAKAIVAAKLQNSRKVADRWARDETNAADGRRLADCSARIRERIARLPGAETADHVRGIEGDAARIYFRAVGQVPPPTAGRAAISRS